MTSYSIGKPKSDFGSERSNPTFHRTLCWS